MDAATRLKNPLKAATFEILVGLLACTGLRAGEAMRLDRSDFDAERALLVVRNSKFNKSRQVLLHATTVEALRRYGRIRDELCSSPPSPALLVSSSGARLGHPCFSPPSPACSTKAASARQHHAAPGFTISAIPSLSPPWLVGIATAKTSQPACRLCRPISAMSIPAPRIGTCRRRPSCSDWPQIGSKRRSETRNDRARPDPPGLLHRPTDRPAPGERPHDRRLSRHLPATAVLRRSPHRQGAVDLDITDLDTEAIDAFLAHLRDDRRNGPRTTNARLSAIHSLFRYAAFYHPEHAESIQGVLGIEPARFDKTLIAFLEPDEVDALLAAPDRSRWFGRRDHALLVLAIQTGLRVSELTGLTCRGPAPGKGAARAASAVANTARHPSPPRSWAYSRPGPTYSRVTGTLLVVQVLLWLCECANTRHPPTRGGSFLHP